MQRQPRKKKNPESYQIPTEYQECKAFWDYCQHVLKLGNRIIHHANEGKRSPVMGKILKNIGLTPGVCDYQYIMPSGKYHGCWIEMKRRHMQNVPKNPAQVEFIEMLNSSGHYASFAYGMEDAIKILTDYIQGRC